MRRHDHDRPPLLTYEPAEVSPEPEPAVWPRMLALIGVLAVVGGVMLKAGDWAVRYWKPPAPWDGALAYWPCIVVCGVVLFFGARYLRP